MIRPFLLSLFLICFTFPVGAKRVVIQKTEDIQLIDSAKSNRYVVKADVDLQGESVAFGPKSTIVFRKGSLFNGKLIGLNTKVQSSNSNVFRNCILEGNWIVKYASSLMFDNDMPAVQLFKNMACLSSVLKLYSNRVFLINSQDESIHVNTIESGGKEKATIQFHTTNPNVPGINIIGDNISLRNLIIIDDYNINNDVIYGANNNLIGNTITIIAEKEQEGNLLMEGCDFKGGTSSSFVASSQVKHCIVKDCSFSGYMADHGIYCSIRTETFDVNNCRINDVTNAIGLFKVRDSNYLQSFKMKNIAAHNFNGYLVAISFLSTPSAVVEFNDISIQKEDTNNSVFYGFCLSDGTKGLEDNVRNVERISFTNCTFSYGYQGCSVIYPGAGKNVVANSINYNNVNAINSNFGGGSSQEVIVKQSHFQNLCGNRGIFIKTNSLIIEDTLLSSNADNHINSLFTINNSNDCSLSLKDVTIDLPINNLFSIPNDNITVKLSLDNCYLMGLSREVFVAPSKSNVEYTERNCKLSRK